MPVEDIRNRRSTPMNADNNAMTDDSAISNEISCCDNLALVQSLLDEIFGYEHFLNEIVWSYRTGGQSRRWFARKHDTILVYARSRGRHKFNVLRNGEFRTDGLNYDETGRPYKNTTRGRLYFHPGWPAMTDVWELPFLSTVSLERNGYPTQKPEALLERIIRASSDPGDVVADFFCGS